MVPLLVLAVTLGGPPATSSPGAPRAPLDACALLTATEVEAVQGETPRASRSRAQASGGTMRVHCLFELPTLTNSVSLEVTASEPGAGAPGAARTVFRELFHQPSPGAGTQAVGAPGEKKEPKGPPVTLAGIGEEAFWIGGDLTGALYVLQGDAFLRISVGGPGGSAAKIEKSRILAGQAAARLPGAGPRTPPR